MKIVTYNIRFGLGLDQRVDLPRIADCVRDADIVGLQEVERFWRRSGMIDQPEKLGQLLDNFYWNYAPTFDIDASVRNSEHRVLNRRRQFGTMLLSRWPLLSARTLVFPQLPTFNVLGMATGALECVVQSACGVLRIYCIHLSAASSIERSKQIDALLTMHGMIERCGRVLTLEDCPTDLAEAANHSQMDWDNGEPQLPVPDHTIFLGDFNFTEDSDEYSHLLGKCDPVYGRGVHSGSLVDSWTVAQQTIGEPLTWWPDPADRPPAKPLRLDYCFVNTEFSGKIARAWVDTEAMGSDHKPYWIEVSDQ